MINMLVQFERKSQYANQCLLFWSVQLLFIQVNTLIMHFIYLYKPDSLWKKDDEVFKDVVISRVKRLFMFRVESKNLMKCVFVRNFAESCK